MFIVTMHHNNRTYYVCAPAGWYRKSDGTMSRDNPNSDVEWTLRRDAAYLFISHRAAARAANVSSRKIVQVA